MEKNYIIIHAHNIFDLENLVNDKIDLGYIPIGGICVDKLCFAQAMIKKEIE